MNKIWSVGGQTGRAPGSLYIFLSDGTLVMTSCIETYRLATWRAETDSRITISEDQVVRYEADIAEIADRHARLRLHLENEIVEVALQVADVPYVCPDLRP